MVRRQDEATTPTLLATPQTQQEAFFVFVMSMVYISSSGLKPNPTGKRGIPASVSS